MNEKSGIQEVETIGESVTGIEIEVQIEGMLVEEVTMTGDATIAETVICSTIEEVHDETTEATGVETIRTELETAMICSRWSGRQSKRALHLNANRKSLRQI